MAVYIGIDWSAAKHDGSCRFRGVEHNGIAFAAPRPVIGLRMEVSHDAVSAQYAARRTGML